MPNQNSNSKIEEIWDQIHGVFLDELQSIPDSHDNHDFLQNLLTAYKPINPHISLSVVSVAMVILESLWKTNDTYSISFDQIIGSNYTSSTCIENKFINQDPQIYFDIFEEILNYALILPFNVISEAFNTCKSYDDFKIFIKTNYQKGNLQLKGRYYTPPKIAHFIVEKTLKDFQPNNLEKILDLCSGTGSFSTQICQKLFLIYVNLTKNLTDVEIKHKIIQHHLRTIDVDPIATYILRIQLLLWFLESNPNPEEMKNFLPFLINATKIDNILENPDIFSTKFHYIISNPPYISEKSNKRYIDLMIRNKASRFYKPRLDYYLHFLAYTFEHIEDCGKLGFIIPSYFIDTKSASKIRKYLYHYSYNMQIFDFQNEVLFLKAPGFHSSVLFCQFGTLDDSVEKFISYYSNNEDRSISIPYTEAFLKEFNYMLKFSRKPDFGRLDNFSKTLKDIAEVRQGVVAGPDRLRKTNKRKLDTNSLSKNQGIFVLSNEEVIKNGFTSDEVKFLLPFSYVRDLKDERYLSITEFHPSHQIIYLNDAKMDKSQVSNIFIHLRRFQPIMDSRRETQMGKRLWYELHWPRSREIFEKPRIISIRRTLNPRFILAEIPFVTDLSTNIIIPNENIDVRELFEYLVSAEVVSWINYYAKRKGRMLQVDKVILEKIPVPDNL